MVNRKHIVNLEENSICIMKYETVVFQIVPCNKKGKEYTENDDIWVDNPKDMVGKDLYFMSKILSARGIPSRFTVS